MFNLIKDELKREENYTTTENGAIGYKSTNSALVDLNFKVSSLRQATEDEIEALFDNAFNEDKKYAMKWLFFARDIREGLGERRLFRICYRRLSELDMNLFCQNLRNISEYGRWDDLVSLLNINDTIDQYVMEIIEEQLKNDLENYNQNKPISLLAKWLPSENASSVNTKKAAKKVRRLLDLSPRRYRLLLSKLREHLKVVEVQMCNNDWNEIDYERVPSLANLKYKNAFMKHDETRRSQYLASVEKGASKMNMSVATPVDVVSKYMSTSMWHPKVKEYDQTLELAWENLKDIMVEDTLVVADGSGSMTTSVGGKTTALDVANALAIYTSEHNSGIYKDQYITFSSKPQFVDFSDKKTLRGKLEIALKHDECSNTNIEAVFDLILGVAIKNKISKEEMVSNILIISDMEFDSAQRGWRSESNFLTQLLFEAIKEKYNNAGYDLPRLVFWNVNSRTGAIPLTQNELGVALLSGFSQNVLKMAMSSKYDPYEILIETLDSPRYDPIKI